MLFRINLNIKLNEVLVCYPVKRMTKNEGFKNSSLINNENTRNQKQMDFSINKIFNIPDIRHS